MWWMRGGATSPHVEHRVVTPLADSDSGSWAVDDAFGVRPAVSVDAVRGRGTRFVSPHSSHSHSRSMAASAAALACDGGTMTSPDVAAGSGTVTVTAGPVSSPCTSAAAADEATASPSAVVVVPLVVPPSNTVAPSPASSLPPVLPSPSPSSLPGGRGALSSSALAAVPRVSTDTRSRSWSSSFTRSKKAWSRESRSQPQHHMTTWPRRVLELSAADRSSEVSVVNTVQKAACSRTTMASEHPSNALR